MQSNFEKLTSSESLKAAPEISFDGLQSFRISESATNLDYARNKATMLAFDGNNAFTLIDSPKASGKASAQAENIEPRGNQGEAETEDETVRGEDDVRWAKELLGANPNNADSKDLKESLGRTKQNEMPAVYNELKNLKHDDAMQILRDKLAKIAGADKGISMQELANEFENDKNPKNRAACIYATRYFTDFARANNLIFDDWSGPTIEAADIDKAKKPGY